MSVTKSIQDNLGRINERIAAACASANRNPDEITLVAVSKFADADAVRSAYEAGCRVFGENRVRESSAKVLELKKELVEASWHMIGHLQTNKAKKSLEMFDMIQSVDSLHLAEEINRRAAEAERNVDILLEVNSSGETQKHGVAPTALAEFANQVSLLPALNLRGIMSLGPHTQDQAQIQRAFSLTRELFEEFSKKHSQINDLRPPILSMGMTADFELAIAEGATMLRIGTAIFGSRTDT